MSSPKAKGITPSRGTMLGMVLTPG